MRLTKYFYLFFSLILVFSNCTKEFGLNTKSIPPEGGEVFPPEGVYKEGTVVTLNAVPNGEYEFEKWSGDASGTSKTTEVIINGFSYFEKFTYTFIIKFNIRTNLYKKLCFYFFYCIIY